MVKGQIDDGDAASHHSTFEEKKQWSFISPAIISIKPANGHLYRPKRNIHPFLDEDSDRATCSTFKTEIESHQNREEIRQRCYDGENDRKSLNRNGFERDFYVWCLQTEVQVQPE